MVKRDEFVRVGVGVSVCVCVCVCFVIQCGRTPDVACMCSVNRSQHRHLLPRLFVIDAHTLHMGVDVAMMRIVA